MKYDSSKFAYFRLRGAHFFDMLVKEPGWIMPQILKLDLTSYIDLFVKKSRRVHVEVSSKVR